MVDIDSKGRKFASTPLYDRYHTLVEEGIQLGSKTAKQDPFILTEIPVKGGESRNLWFEEKVYRAKHGHNNIVSVFGPTSFYKSTWAITQAMENQWIYYKLGMTKQKAWTLQNIMYQSLDVQQRIQILAKNLKPGQPLCTSFVIDEQPAERAGRDVSYFQWTSDFEKQVRKLLLNLYFCSPTLETHVAHFVIQMYDWDETNRLMRALVYTNDGFLIGSIIIPMPQNKFFEMYNDKVKDPHLLDITNLRNKSIEIERKIAIDLSSEKSRMMGDVEGFPNIDYWMSGPATQVQYVMAKYSIKVIQQAKDIRNLACDFYRGKHGDLPKVSRKKGFAKKSISKEIMKKCKRKSKETDTEENDNEDD